MKGPEMVSRNNLGFKRRGAIFPLVSAALAISLGTTIGLSATANAAPKATLNAIFLPATWGTVVKDTLAPLYEKETGVKVNVQLIGRDEIHQKMGTLFAAQDSSFDIFNLDYNWIPEFGRAQDLLPLDSVLSSADKKDFLPGALRLGTYQGQILGIPQTIHPALLWYRADLYNDPKVKAQYKKDTGSTLAPPRTMEVWAKQAAWFNGKTFDGQKVYGWAAQAAKGFGNVHTWLSFCYSYGCEPFNSDFTKSTLSTPKSIAATTMWAKMMKFMPPGANDFTYDSVTQAAQQGTIATAIQWSWGAFAVDDPANSKTVGKWQFVQVPAGPGAKSSPHIAEWVIAVSKFSKNQAEAKKFVAWLETKKNDVIQANLGGGDPVRRSSYNNPILSKQTLPGSKTLRFRRYPEVLKAIASGQPRPLYPSEEKWETMLSTELSAISLGQKTVTAGLASADATIDSSLSGN